MDPHPFEFHHLGVAVADMAAAVRDYRELFGYEVRSGPFDDPVQRVTVCFLGRPAAAAGAAAEPEIELIAPLGDDSPVRRLLKAGGGAYHTCYAVADVDAALRRARETNCLVVSGPVPAVAFGGRRIAWFYTPARQLVEVVEREPR
ncbi:MAG TPA: VOC family protein [Humisphaera sp.]